MSSRNFSKGFLSLFLSLSISFWFLPRFSFSDGQAASEAPESERLKKMRPRALRQGEILSAEELRALQRKGTALLLFDARGRKPYEIAHIEGAVLPLSIDYYRDAELFKAGILSSQPDADRELAQAMRQYPKDTAIVTYCGRDCQASTVLVLKLKELGFTNVKAMKEGIEVWEERGYPVVSGSIR